MIAEQKKKVFWYSVWGAVAVAVVAILTLQAMQDPPPTSKPSFLSDLIIITARTLPNHRLVDENTTFIRAQAANSHTLMLYYNVPGYDAGPNDFNVAEVKSVVAKSVCDSEMKKEQSILSLGGTYVYVYSSKHVKEIGRFEVNKQSCEGVM